MENAFEVMGIPAGNARKLLQAVAGYAADVKGLVNGEGFTLNGVPLELLVEGGVDAEGHADVLIGKTNGSVRNILCKFHSFLNGVLVVQYRWSSIKMFQEEPHGGKKH